MDFKTEKELLIQEVDLLLSGFKKNVSKTNIDSLEDKISLITEIRTLFYEDINQILHKNLLINIIQTFTEKTELKIIDIIWNPKQTSQPENSDIVLILVNNDKIQIEGTTSKKCVGAIRNQMNKTLFNLNKRDGEKYYVVGSESMKKSAEYHIQKMHYNITVYIWQSSKRADDGVKINCKWV